MVEKQLVWIICSRIAIQPATHVDKMLTVVPIRVKRQRNDAEKKKVKKERFNNELFEISCGSEAAV